MKVLRCCLALALASFAVFGLGACGNLDDVTTVHDLRVLALKAEYVSVDSMGMMQIFAGFLVPLDDPGSLTTTTPTVTALVVDPQRPNDVLTMSAEACPDYLDTITSASGRSTKLCPGKDVTDAFGPTLGPALATSEIPPSAWPNIDTSTIEYDPKIMYGLTPQQLALFFTLPPGADPNPSTTDDPFTKAIRYNRDFGLDAIVNPTFTLGAETASAIKRVVYWPLLPPDLAQVGPALDGGECPPTQIPNRNPELMDVGFFHKRTDGIPSDPYAAGQTPAISVATDELYVQPAYDPSAAEYYRLRRRDDNTGEIKTECDHETLIFQFFATAGTFAPAERTSVLPAIFDQTARVPLDSQYKPPKGDALPKDGVVTIWVVTRDERAGASWTSRKIMVMP